jgi:hypothetical protein
VGEGTGEEAEICLFIHSNSTVPEDERNVHYEVGIIGDTEIQSQERALLIVKET